MEGEMAVKFALKMVKKWMEETLAKVEGGTMDGGSSG